MEGEMMGEPWNGERIQKLRERLCLSRNELAELLGISYRQLYNAEIGSSVPPVGCFHSLDLLEAKADDLDLDFQIDCNPGLIMGIRMALSLTQKDLSSLLGATKSSVCNWEQGKRTPSPYFRRKILQLAEKAEEEILNSY
jgi:transcriptional regulator with XRE-family HTH domain